MPTIQEQMAANSAAWHNATTQEEKDRLHQENVNLASQLNSGATFDSGTGKWSGVDSGSTVQNLPYSGGATTSNLPYSGGASTVGYNENTDYTAEIQKAINSGASIDYINQLNAERNAKIAANQQKYGQYANDTQSMIDNYTTQVNQTNSQITNLQNQIASLQNTINELSTQQNTQQSTSDTDATEYLKQMYAAQKEQELANLKSQYNESRNNIASQSALSNNMFNEQAIAAGLNTGASGQAALARSAAQRSNLASLDEAYLQALQSAQSEGDSALAQALYQELVRQQNLEAQQQAEENEMALAYAQLAAQQNNTSPTLTAAQAKSAYDSGLRTQEVLEAYDYYYGTNYANGGTTNTTQNTQNTQETKKVSYNNGSLTTEQIKNLQRRLNAYLPADQQIAVDGYWGPATQAAANGMSADDYYEAVYIENTRNKNLGAR